MYEREERERERKRERKKKQKSWMNKWNQLAIITQERTHI